MRRENKAVFLDRDGTLIKLVYNRESEIIDTVNNPNEVMLLPDIARVLLKLKKLGYLLIIISNQPRVGINKLSLELYKGINKKVEALFKKEGVFFDFQYYCMHHPFAHLRKYRIKCHCRKPGIKFFRDAEKKFNIDLSKSWVIGDGVNDVLAGHDLSIKTILLANINEGAYLEILEKQLGKIKPNFLVKKPIDILQIIHE